MLFKKEHWNGKGIVFSGSKVKYYDEENQWLEIYENNSCIEGYEKTDDWGQIINVLISELKKEEEKKLSVVTVLTKETLFEISSIGEGKFLIEDVYDDKSLYYFEKEKEIECNGYYERADYIPTIFLRYIENKPKRITIRKKEEGLKNKNEKENFFNVSKAQSEFFEKNKKNIENAIKIGQKYAEEFFLIKEELIKKVFVRKMKSNGLANPLGELKICLTEGITKEKIEAIIFHEFGHFIDFKMREKDEYKNKAKEFKLEIVKTGFLKETRDSYLRNEEELIARTVETILLKKQYGQEFEAKKEVFLDDFDEEYLRFWYMDEDIIRIYKEMFYKKK